MKFGRKPKGRSSNAGLRSYSAALRQWSKLHKRNTHTSAECQMRSDSKFLSSDDEATSYSSSENNYPQFEVPFSTDQDLKRERPKVNDSWIFGRVLDPQSRSVKKINQLFLLSCSIGMFIDPLFLFPLTVNKQLSCLHVDRDFAAAVTVIRVLVDAMYVWHMWLQLKLAFVSKQSLVLGYGELVWDAREIAVHYLCALDGFVYDLFVILPIPQVILWFVVPSILERDGEVTYMLQYVLAGFLLYYIPKVGHLFLLTRRMQRVTGYVFGSAWWGFALNLFSYTVAAHVAGACWYFLGLERVEQCLEQECLLSPNCTLDYLRCPRSISSLGIQPKTVQGHVTWGKSSNVIDVCFNQDGTYVWGMYTWVVPLVRETNGLQKMLLPLFWGIMTLSSFGNNVAPSNNFVEVSFCVIMATGGLLLFAILMANIQVFINASSSRKETMQMHMRDLEWWMRRRQLPARVRDRVRQFERQKWSATRGIDETAMVGKLPEVLRRDIKRHLCENLVRQVPLFDQLDDIVVNQICERLKPMLFMKRETVVNAGDPVLRMIFVARGYLQSEYIIGNGNISCCVLGPGTFCGDELLSWCFKKAPLQRFPLSPCTLRTLTNCEVFGFEAEDLRYITEHFRFIFANQRLKNTARYYSSSWRTWAAVTIQLGWRRFKKQRDEKTEKPSATGTLANGLIAVNRDSTQRNSLGLTENDRLRLYTAMFTSPKPTDDLE